MTEPILIERANVNTTTRWTAYTGSRRITQSWASVDQRLNSGSNLPRFRNWGRSPYCLSGGCHIRSINGARTKRGTEEGYFFTFEVKRIHYRGYKAVRRYVRYSCSLVITSWGSSLWLTIFVRWSWSLWIYVSL